MTRKGWPVLLPLVGVLLATLGYTVNRTVASAGQPQVPQDVAQRLAPDCPAQHSGGPVQLTPQQPTRITVVCRVTNPLSETVDYSATMTFVLGDRAAVVGGSAQRGQVAVVGRQITWGGFVLAPGESATASAEVEVTPVTGDTGRPIIIFTTTRTSARLASGGIVQVDVGPVTTAVVSGLTSGGIVVIGAGAAPAQGPAPVGPAAAGGGTAVGPRTGTGRVEDGPSGLTLLSCALFGLIVLIAPVAVHYRRRSAWLRGSR